MSGITSLKGIEPGDLFTRDGHDVWEVVAMSHAPTIRLRNIRQPEEMIYGSVGSPNLEKFLPLVCAAFRKGAGNA